MFGVGLSQIANVLSKFESRNLQVDPRQCSRLRHKKSTCQRCMEQCPEHAISVQASVEINPDKCTGCGICASICPTGALQALTPTNAELLSRIEQRKNSACLAFACPRGAKPADERVIQVSCLGRLDESLLVGAAAWGIERILLVEGPCEKCPNAAGRSLAAQVVAETNALTEAVGLAPRANFVSELEPLVNLGTRSSAAPDAVSRRAFFSMLTRESKAAAALTVGSVLEAGKETKAEVKRGELPQRVPDKRELLLESLKRVDRTTGPDFKSQKGSWAACRITEKCTGCQMCAFFCPTGALSKTEQDGKPALAFRVSRCTACDLCKDICFWHAIELFDRIDLPRALEDESETFLFPQGNKPLTAQEKLKRLMQSLS